MPAVVGDVVDGGRVEAPLGEQLEGDPLELRLGGHRGRHPLL